ncbi:hypothetical protein ACROYT_G005695 [Oculina patagonica]
MVPCMSDMYMHFPPGSNNRLNGNQDNVRNANRLFDSQNNGKAGYNVGDSLDSNPGDNIQEFRQLPMEFYMSRCDAKAKSEVEIMWTNQHGTGPKTDDRVETQVILQYMCQAYPEGKMATNVVDREFEYHTIRNGQTLNTQGFGNGGKENTYIRRDRGLHEPANYYQAYFRRERNKGLFTADQQLKGDLPIYTRQNAAGTRRGLEVPEERDYYPYWGPSPWKDIAIMVSNKKTEDLMKNYVNSPEYGYKYMCIMPSKLTGNANCPPENNNDIADKCVAKYITAESCKAAGGTWTKFITNYLEKTAGILSSCEAQGGLKVTKGLPYEPNKLSQGSDEMEQYVLLHKPPDVIYAPSTVVNHNGMNMEGKFSSYKWKVPCFPTNTTQRCVLRLRYNITTNDVPREFDASNNKDVTNDPTTKAVDDKTDLQLALNTAQLGRTFQDRSHVIILKPRSDLPPKYQHSNIYYIGGMGKRGNIVQAYPAMEYRFTPERISVTTNDVVCFVWSGSNNNQNNDGEGRARSDRTNVCWVTEGCNSEPAGDCFKKPVGISDPAKILDSHMSASSQFGNGFQPAYGRLNGDRGDGWCAKESNRSNDWLQVDLGREMRVCGVSTQGDRNGNEWVTDFKLSYSSDGNTWTAYKDADGTEVEFHRQGDSNTVDQHKLPVSVSARYFRFHPTKQHEWNCLRVELYGDVSLGCHDAIGMENRAISDVQISSSSRWDNNHAPEQARLQFTAAGSKQGAWSSGKNNANQWLQIYLVNQYKVTGVASQGRNGRYDQWVTKYQLQYSDDGVNFQDYGQGEAGNKDFAGNTDKDSVVYHELNPPITARYIRFRPVAWHGHISMRVELYGCPVKVCQKPLGMSTGAISDGQITASSQWNSNHAAVQGRLFFTRTGPKSGSWSSRKNDGNQWLQIDLGPRHTGVTGVATQGRSDYNQWVTQYRLQYSDDGVNFQDYGKGQGGAVEDKDFTGNKDRDSVVYHELNPPIKARYIRFRPKAWVGHISMRVELYGCLKGRSNLSLKPKTCSNIPLEVVDPSDLSPAQLNLQLVKGCYKGDNLQAQLDNAPASCNPPCFRITKPGKYCYMGTRNNNFSNRRHMGQITVSKANAD